MTDRQNSPPKEVGPRLGHHSQAEDTDTNDTSSSHTADTFKSNGSGHSAADAALVARGKALVDSGKHAPAPRQWTAAELRYWFRPAQSRDVVVNLGDYRQRRRGVASS